MYLYKARETKDMAFVGRYYPEAKHNCGKAAKLNYS